MEPELPPATPHPLRRLWVISVLLFACGVVGRVVLGAQPGAGDGSIVVMMWQAGWYAAGLVTWLAWANTRPAGDKLGCGVGVGLAVASVLAVLSSSPH